MMAHCQPQSQAITRGWRAGRRNLLEIKFEQKMMARRNPYPRTVRCGPSAPARHLLEIKFEQKMMALASPIPKPSGVVGMLAGDIG